MQLFLCNSVRGRIPEGSKSKIAAEITEFSCNISGSPRETTHVFFLEDAPKRPIHGKSVFMFCNTPITNSEDLNQSFVRQMKRSIMEHTDIALSEIAVGVSELPDYYVMDGTGFIYTPETV